MQAAKMSRKEAARRLPYFVGEEIADDFAQPAIYNTQKNATQRMTTAICHIAGNFFSTARAVIGYFEMVTWHLTMKAFPAKISGRATLHKIYVLIG